MLHRKLFENFSTANKDELCLLLKSAQALRQLLHKLGTYIPGKYLHDHFIYWLSSYVKCSPNSIHAYFLGKKKFNTICREFIRFCFERKISLDCDMTLQSFVEQHNLCCDDAVKSELSTLDPRNTINLLGFGIGNGSYEKWIAQYIIENKLASTVNIYGFDPYAEKTNGVELLSPNQLTDIKTPFFDVIIARWVLHHVPEKYRWADFINCINHTHPSGLSIIIEHGYLMENVSETDRKLSNLLNATFDIIANIGIRPDWFSNTAPDYGENFYVRYLTEGDFEKIKKGIKNSNMLNTYNVGPGFPNQTIYTIRT